LCRLIPEDFGHPYHAIHMSGAYTGEGHLNVPAKTTAYLFLKESGRFDRHHYSDVAEHLRQKASSIHKTI
jgi:hypothetical protein